MPTTLASRVVASAACPTCDAKPGTRCHYRNGGERPPHMARIAAYHLEHPRGGRRKGAGRPAVEGSRTALVSARVQPSTLTWLQERAEAEGITVGRIAADIIEATWHGGHGIAPRCGCGK